MSSLSVFGRIARMGLLVVFVTALLPAQHLSRAAISAAPANAPTKRNVSQGIAPGALIINEVSAANLNGLRDDYNETEDWIELYNASASTLNLGGVGLSDNATTPFKWTFASTVTLASHAYLLIFASKRDRNYFPPGFPNARLHTNFSLNNGSEPVVLTGPDSTTLDTFAPRFTKPDFSYGRQPDGSAGGSAIETFLAPTPGAANTTPSFAQMLPAPVFSVGGGFYSNTVSLVLTSSVPSATIRYTLDGSVPTDGSPEYTTPLNIVNRINDPNVYSIIPSIPAASFLPPGGVVYKSTVVRAVAFQTGTISSTIGTNTYFVDPNVGTKYAGLPVVSLAVDPDGFWSDARGIYVPGPNADSVFPYSNANFWQQNWERPAHIEYFSVGRVQGFSHDFGTEIQGGYTRGFPSHSLAIKILHPEQHLWLQVHEGDEAIVGGQKTLLAALYFFHVMTPRLAGTDSLPVYALAGLSRSACFVWD